MSDEAIAAVVPERALGYSILANLGDEKQLTIQCYVSSEEELSLIHSQVDKAMAVVDRQKAKYRLKDLKGEVEKMERTLRQLEDDLARLEQQYAENKNATNQRILELGKQRQALQDAAIARGRVSGPQGADKANFTNMGKEMEGLRENLAKADADRAQARDNAATNIDRYRTEIAKAKDQMAECEALIGDGG